VSVADRVRARTPVRRRAGPRVAAVLSGQPTLHQAQRFADDVRAILADLLSLTHMTLEFEEGPTVGIATPRTSPH